MNVFTKPAPAPKVAWGSAKARSNKISSGKMDTTKNVATSSAGMGHKSKGRSGCSTCGK